MRSKKHKCRMDIKCPTAAELKKDLSLRIPEKIWLGEVWRRQETGQIWLGMQGLC